jgi:hypothetical protein
MPWKAMLTARLLLCQLLLPPFVQLLRLLLLLCMPFVQLLLRSLLLPLCSLLLLPPFLQLLRPLLLLLLLLVLLPLALLQQLLSLCPLQPLLFPPTSAIPAAPSHTLPLHCSLALAAAPLSQSHLQATA